MTLTTSPPPAPAPLDDPAAQLARLRLRAATPVLDRGRGEVQLGTDPRWALQLAGLTEGEVEWLRGLASRRHVSPVSAADRHGISRERCIEVLGMLRSAGFLHPLDGGGARSEWVSAVSEGVADLSALGSLRPDGAGRATLVRRAGARVAVVGLGRIGAAVAAHLATAGVGTLVLRDTAPVQTTDLGLGVYAATDVGACRHEALSAVLGRVAPRARVRPDGAADVVVLVEAHVPAPARYARLMGEGVAHLLVTVREADVVVGPFVIPGVTPCARCADLHRADEDSAWPLLAAQLRQAAEVPQETSLAAVAAAVAGAQVLAHVDGLRPASAGALVEVALPQALPVTRTFTSHPRCGCTDLGAGAVRSP